MTDNRYDAIVGNSTRAATPSRATRLLGKYDSLLDDADRQQAQANVLADPNPDVAARANRYERQLGVPAALAQDDIKNYDTEARRRDTYAASVAHPNIGRFLSDPRAAAVAHDDLPALSKLSQGFKDAWARVDASKKAARTPDARSASPLLPVFDRLPGIIWNGAQDVPHAVAETVRGIPQALQRAVPQLLQGVSGASAFALETINGAVDMAVRGDPRKGQRFRDVAPVRLPGVTPAAEHMLKREREYATVSEAMDPKTDSRVARGLLNGVSSLPLSAAALGAAAMGQPQLGAAMIAGVTGGTSYGSGRAEGLTHGQAALYGGVDAAIEYGTEVVPALHFFGDVKAGTGAFKRLLRNMAEEQVGEQTATALQDLNKWAAIDQNKGKTFGQYLAERPDAAIDTALAVVASVGASHVAVTYGEKIAARADKVISARESAKTLTGLTDNAVASKLRARDPEKFREFVAQTVEGSSAEHVYIPVEAIDTYMQSEGFEDTGGVFEGLAAQIEEARVTGGDVVIPTADVLSTLAGTPAWAVLQQDARIDAGGLSVKEALTEGEAVRESIANRGKEIAAANETDAARADPAQQVFTATRDRLVEIGQSRNVATQNAALFAASREAWGARLGMTALEYHEANPVTFERGTFGQTPGSAATVMDQVATGERLYHGSTKPNLSIDDVQIVRTEGQKQGKKGRVYGGFYAAAEDRVSDAEGYAGVDGTVHAIDLKPGAVIEDKTGDITRLSADTIAEARARGVDVMRGLDPRGRTEYAIINKDAIARIAPRTQADRALADTGFASRMPGFHTAAIDGAEIGYTVLPDARSVEINTVQVPEELRRQGVARAAMTRFLSSADANGQTVFLTPASPTLDKFYKSLGFVQNRETPALFPAIRHNGKTYKSVADHMSALSQIEDDTQRGRAQLDGDNRGFVTERGKYLNRFRAQEYAVANGLLREDAPAWAKTSPDLITENLQRFGDRPTLARPPSNVLFQDDVAPVFFSALKKAVQDTKTAKAPASQWKATIQNTAGVKAEELEWSGLLDVLDFDPKAVFTKQQIVDVLDAGGISVDEELLGDALDEDAVGKPDPWDYESDEEYESALEYWRENASEETATQFHEYSSGRGKDDTYRELLLTLPAGEGNNPDRAPDTHWDQPRVVAHSRFSEKTDVDGKRVLFIEEIQSDWHQKGRTQGYAGAVDQEAINAAQAKYDEANAAWKEADRAYSDAVAASLDIALDAVEYSESKYAEIKAREKEAEKQETLARQRHQLAARELRAANNPDGIPEAPFKSTWPQLVMKRMIRWASDNGFERIAWINGDQQNGGVTGQDEGVAEFYEKILPKTVQKLVGKHGAKVDVVEIADTKSRDDQRAALLDKLRQFGTMSMSGVTTRAEAESRIAEYQGLIDRSIGSTGRAGLWIQQLTTALPVLDQLEAFDSGKQVGSKQLGFDITSELAAVAHNGFPLFQDKSGVRGQIALYPSRSVITLFENADLSTLIHETGHLFLEELQRNAALPTAPQDVRDDWAKTQKWFADSGVPLAGGVIPREAHEMWARGFERYAMEGKAPSSSLQSAFASFRAWLLRVYAVVDNLRSPVTPEIRQVFDRMLATQAAIDEYAQQQNIKAAWTDAQAAGMTDAEWEAYQRSIVQAKDDAYDALLFKTMHRIKMQRRTAYAEKAKAIRAEITEATNDEPRFRALRLLRTGKLGTEDVADAKLDSAWLVERYGDDILARLPANVRAGQNGGDADTLAQMTGFSGGAEMVDALLAIAEETAAMRASGDKRQLRDKMIDERVAAGIDDAGIVDPMTDGSIEQEAIEALDNDRQGDVLATELRHLARRTKSSPTPYRLAREWAKTKIESGQVKEAASRSALQRYARAAAKASRAAEAAIIAGDTDEAFRQKQGQMLNHALYVEAKIAADEVDAIVARMGKLSRRAAMKSVDQDYFDRVHELLERFDFRPKSQRALDEKEGFDAWAAKRIAQGFEVNVPARLLGEGQHYTRIDVQDLYGLRDAVESLMSLGRLKQNILDAQKQRTFDSFVDEIVGKVSDLPDRKLPEGVNEDPRRVAGFMSELLKIETIAAELDGGDPHGPLTRLLVQRASDAENKRHALRERTLAPIAKQYLDMPAKERKRLEERVTIPELPHIGAELDPRNGQPSTMTRMELLSIALNTGNASNFDKLTRGEKWNPNAVRGVLDRELTAFDWQFVQSIWDSIDTLWPEIAATERALSGVVPEKVAATPIVTRHGTFAGGYYPVVYDFDRSQKAEDYKADDLNDLFGFASGVSTPKGHTITRTEAAGPLRRSVEDVVFRHVERVVTRISYAEYARDVLRVIKQPRVRSAIDLKLGSEYRAQIEPWLKRVVNSGAVDGRGARWMQDFMRSARSNMSIVAMGFRVSTGIAQTAGLAASAAIIGPQNVANGIRLMSINPANSVDFVMSRSPEMARRGDEVNREISEFHRHVRGKTGLITTAQRMAFWHIGLIDRYGIAVPTWLGAHAKGIAEGMTDVQASYYADSAVRQSQGSGAEKDLAAIQSTSNGEAMKWMTLFYTYFNVQFNAQWTAGRAAKRGDWRKAMVLTGWFMVMSPLIDALLSGDVPWGFDDDDKDELGVPRGWAEWFARNVFFNTFSGIPGVRDAANIAERKVNGQYAGAITTPIGRVYDSTERAGKAAYDIYDSDSMTGRQLQTMVETPGYFLGLPTGQPGATAGFLWDYAQGETEPDGFTDWYYGMTKGKVPEKKDE